MEIESRAVRKIKSGPNHWVSRESVGITEGAEAISSEIKRLIGRLETMGAERSRLEADIERCLAQTPGAGLLLTIPDFGQYGGCDIGS